METREIDIDTPDGVMSTYEVVPDGEGPHAAVVFLMDGLGYRDALQGMARRLASHGYHVMLPDLYHRVGRHVTFDPAVMTQPEKMAEMRRLIGGLTSDAVLRDFEACVAVLATRATVDTARLGTVGYCMGGRHAFVLATRLGDRVRAAAAIHPGGLVTDAPESPHRAAEGASARLYIAVAKDDVFFTRAQADTLDATLRGLSKRYAIEHYEARHGWSVNGTPVYDEAESERHWRALEHLFGEALAAT